MTGSGADANALFGAILTVLFCGALLSWCTVGWFAEEDRREACERVDGGVFLREVGKCVQLVETHP